MGKKLEEMSLESLWHLFPIELVPHQDEWETNYQKEAAFIRSHLPSSARISHIGSTAIPDIRAKDIVDILLETKDEDCAICLKAIPSLGYLLMNESPSRASFNKGYTEDGYKPPVFHLHLRRWGDNDGLYFRDYILEHPLVAKEYEQLKLRLAEPFRYNRDGYTEAKGEFVKRITELAKKEYGPRYAK